MLTLLIVTLVFSGFLLASLSRVDLVAQRQKKTLETLAQAKDALIAWSVLSGDMGKNTLPRPGELPCPANPAFPGHAKATCSAAAASNLGRLPWKALGVNELRDAHGEPLWYVLSDKFRPAPPNYLPINSNSRGSLLLYAADGASLLTPPGEELAAIVFSPGPALAGQDRMTWPNDPAHFLEGTAGKNNASAIGPFVAGPLKDSQGNVVINDLALGISAKELLRAVEQRALRETQNALRDFARDHAGKFPNPAKATCVATTSDVRSPEPCFSDATTCFGRLPEDSLRNTYESYTASWFKQNAWDHVLIYAANKNQVLNGGGANCSVALRVDGSAAAYLVIAPGTARHGQIRPSSALSDYLEDAANLSAPASSSFVIPGASSNDQLLSFP